MLPSAVHRLRFPSLLLSIHLVAIGAFVTPTHATVDTIYVDNSKSCPGGPGTSTANAYCSVRGALKALSGGPDTVFAVINAGKPYLEDVTLTSIDAGTSGHPFTILARGAITVDGADTCSRWTNVTGNIYRAPVDSSAVEINSRGVTQVFSATGVRYPDTTGIIAANLPAGRCLKIDKAAGQLDSVYVNFGGYNPIGSVAYVSNRIPFKFSSTNYATVTGFTVRRSSGDGITSTGTNSHLTAAGCDVQLSRTQGIMYSGTDVGIIQDNSSSYNFSHGIYLNDSDTNCQVLRNITSYNDNSLLPRGGVNGIRIGSRTTDLGADSSNTHGHRVEDNKAFGNEDTGIEYRCNGVLSRYNQSWNNQDHGFDHLYCVRVNHVGDLAHGNARSGMSFENTTWRDTIRNCVIANNGADPNRKDYEIELDNSGGGPKPMLFYSSDYNVIWRQSRAGEVADSIIIATGNISETPQTGNAGCTSYSTCFGRNELARFKTAHSPLEANSTSKQPLFADSSLAVGNFMPVAGSSVIDDADSTVSGYKTRDLRGFARHDYSGTSNGGYPSGFNYVDMGPYEFDPPPGAVSITVSFGRYEAQACWIASGDDADVGTAQTYYIAHGVGMATLASGSTNASGNPHTVNFSVNECSSYSDVRVIIAETDNGQTSTSNAVSGNTVCSGSVSPECDWGGFSARRSISDGGDGDDDLPLKLALAQPGPNPATTASIVRFDIPRSSAGADYDLSLFDVSGRRVSTVAKGVAKAGRFSELIPFQADNGRRLRSGVYFLRFRVDRELFWRTVVLTN